jgi:prevent-host-death family protein
MRAPHIAIQEQKKKDDSMKVSTGQFVKDCSAVADEAQRAPVTITENGRDCLVLMSAREYARLKRRDRRVVTTGALSEADIALIAKGEVPCEHADLDEEIKDWHS